MNLMGLQIRKIKGTPYKIVMSNWQLIGIFDRGQYIEKKNMTAEQFLASDTFHAQTFKERLESISSKG